MRAQSGMATLVACILGLLTAMASANEPEWICGGGPDDVIPPVSPTVEYALLVFVAFPGAQTPDNLPTYAMASAQELGAFVSSATNGYVSLTVSVVTRADDPSLAWMAPLPSADYRQSNSCPSGGCGTAGFPTWQELNTDIAMQIQNAHGPSIWQGVTHLFFVHYEPAWCCTGIGGYAASGVSGFSGPPWGSGTTQHLIENQADISSEQNRKWITWTMGHEHGHNLWGPGHSPKSGGPGGSCGVPANPAYVNMGRYDIMRANGSHADEYGLVPYHPLWLANNSMVPVTTVSAAGGNTTLTVPDFRSPGTNVFKVLIPNTTQYYLLINHQQTGFDARYGANGLLIWHIWPNVPVDVAWDLESAAGKVPDAVNGRDPLENNWCFNGSVADFWSGGASFSCSSNPNTNLYDDSYQSQPLGTSVALRNIRSAGGASTDMLVDVVFDDVAAQPVLVPNGGGGNPSLIEYYSIGETITVQWTPSEECVPGIDVLMSDKNGLNFVTKILDAPNSGAASFPITTEPTGTGYKVRIVSHHDPNTFVDDSDAPFRIWAPYDMSAEIRGQECDGKMLLRVVWWTTSSANGDDTIELYRPNGALEKSYTYEGLGLYHEHWFWTNPGACQTSPSWTYRVKSRRSYGSGTSIAQAGPLNLSVVCLSCPPPCNPPCELD